jgi:hypothetical protein
LGEKQFDILIGISRNMEKSLSKIQESLNQTTEKAGKANSVLASLSSSLGAMLGAVSVAKITPEKSETVLGLAQGLVDIAKDIDSSKSKEFGEAMESIGVGLNELASVFSPVKLIKLSIGAKILFEGKNPLLKRIVTGMTNAFKDFSQGNMKEGVEAIEVLGKGLSSLTKSIARLALIALIAPLVLIGALTARAVVGLFVSLGKKDKQLREGGRAMKTIGFGLVALAAGMAAMALAVTVIGPAKILESIVVISAFALVFAVIGKVDRHIRKGAKALAYMGLGMIAFTMGLASLMLAIIIATPKLILEGILYIAAFGLVFALLGMADSKIAKGALVMIFGMSLGLFFFSGALMLFGMALMLYTWESMLMGAALITGLGLAFALIGKFDKQIMKGSLAMMEMGVGLAFFSVGVMIFGLAVKLWLSMFGDDLVTAGLMAGGLIIGLGLAVSLVGMWESGMLTGIPMTISMGSMALAEMGIGLAIFSVGVMIYGLAVKLWMSMFGDDLVTAGLMAGGLIAGLGAMTALVGMMSPMVIAGSGALAAMGVGLSLFSVGVMIFGGAIAFLMNMFGGDLLTAGLVAAGLILGLGTAVMLVGLMTPLILPGTASLAAMGIGLTLFSVGILAYGGSIRLLMAMFNNDLVTAGLGMAGIMVGLGLATSLMGLLVVPIVLGVVSLTTMGAGLLVFSVGLLAFAGAVSVAMAAVGADVDTLGDKVSSVLTGIAYAFSEMGLLIVPIVLGSVSLITMGAALLVAGVGLLAFGGALAMMNNQGLIIEGEDGETIKGLGVLGAVATAMAGVGWTFLTQPWTLLGIYSSIGMGVSLMSIGLGLTMAADALAKIPDMNGFVSQLFAEGTGLIPVMAEAFAAIGDKYSGGVLGFLAGLIGADPVSKGMRTIQGMGSALQEIAGGIAVFANFSEFPILAPDPSDPSKLVYSTVDIFSDVMPGIQKNLPPLLTALADVFATIGIAYGGTDGGWFTKGDSSPVRKGIDAVSGLGGILQEVAGGIAAFANFENFPVQVPDPSDPSKLAYQSVNLWDLIPKIKTTLLGDASPGGGGLIMALADIFAEIGNKYGGTEGGWFTADDPSPVRKGIDAISGLGKELEAVVGSVVKFANFDRFPVQTPDPDDPTRLIYSSVNLHDVIPLMTTTLMGDGSVFGGGLIMSLANIFAQIGERYGAEEGGWFSSGSESPVRKGIDAISGLGKELEAVVGSVVKFANFEQFPIQVPDPDDPSKLIYKSVNLFDVIPKMTTLLAGSFSITAGGKWNKEDGLLMSLANIFASIGDKFGNEGFGSDNKVAMGIEAVQGVGKVLSDIAGGIIAFGDIERGIPIYDSKGNIKEYKPFDMAKIQVTIKDVLTMIPKVFEGLDEKQFDKAQDVAKKAIPLADAIGKISESLQKLMQEDDKKSKKKSVLGELGPALKQFIEDTKDLQIDDEKTKSLGKFATVLEKMSKSGKGLGEFADSLSKTAKALVAFTPAFDKFSTKLEKFQVFEQSFSNLVKNQSQYKFDQFAKSMGILKENVNAFNVENLKVTDSLMKSLAILSKSPDALGQQIKESIENAFETLVEALGKMIKEMTPPPPPPSSDPNPVTTGDPKDPKNKDIKKVATNDNLADAFEDALKSFFKKDGEFLKVTSK